MKSIGAAGEVARHRPFEVHIPTAVLEVVGVESDGRILLRSIEPSHMSAAPSRAHNPSHRQVYQATMTPLLPRIDESERADLLREVPGSDHLGLGRGRQHVGPRFDEAREDGGRFELAVEVCMRSVCISGGEHHDRCIRKFDAACDRRCVRLIRPVEEG
jgi:hypothetical protein